MKAFRFSLKHFRMLCLWTRRGHSFGRQLWGAEQNVVKIQFLFLQRKIGSLVTVRLHPGAEGHPRLCCLLACSEGHWEDERYFPSCSRKKPICHPARRSAREILHEGEASCQSSLETPQTIPPTHRSTPLPSLPFCIFPFYCSTELGREQCLWFKTSRRTCLQSCQKCLWF